MLKKKPKVLILLIVALVVIIGLVIVVTVAGKKQKTVNEEEKLVESVIGDKEKKQEEQNKETEIKYATSGNLNDNILDFVVQKDELEAGTELSGSYLQSVNYTVVDVDEKMMVAIVEVEVPDILTELEKIVDETIMKNPDMGYEELLLIVKEKLQKVMKSGKMSMQTEQLEVAVESVEGRYKLVLSDELRDLLYEDLEEAYLENLLGRWEK